MDWKLEVVVVPVTDVDRAKRFYVDTLGFRLDADTRPTAELRVVHMTPPGSACSVVVGPAVFSAGADPGPRASLQLVVTDLEAARAQLTGRGIEVSPVQALGPRDGGSSSSSPTRTATTGPCRRSGSGWGHRWASRRPEFDQARREQVKDVELAVPLASGGHTSGWFETQIVHTGGFRCCSSSSRSWSASSSSASRCG